MKPLLSYLWRGVVTQLVIRPSLALMAATGIALSIASGITTFYGLYAFTQQWWLCLLLTFGIQVLMLVLAWGIGDAYATSVHRGSPRADLKDYHFAFRGIVSLVDRLRNSFVLKNFTIIFFFLVCAFISVFFSFDSHYSAISPPEQRKIAAQVTARTAVSQINADIGVSLEKRQRQLAADLTQGKDWEIFEKRIANVVLVATDPNVERRRLERERERNAQIEADSQKRNTAGADRERLTRERQRLSGELQRIAGERGGLESRLREVNEKVTAKKQELEAKRAQRDEEGRTGRGVASKKGGLNKGKGPVWQSLGLEVAKLEAELSELQAQVKPPTDEFNRLEARRKSAEAELKVVDANLAQVDAVLSVDAPKKPEPAEAPQAGSTISTQQATGSARSLDRALANLRDRRTQEYWDTVVAQCGGIVQLLANTDDFREKARGLDCTPPPATANMAAELFAMEGRRADMAKTCFVDLSGKQFLEIIDHGNNCLQTARLPSADTLPFQRRLDLVRIEQDEKAHTFTKTIAAFERGDKLAYLAALIAIAVDALVFMSGMWGARASVSHLTRGGEETAGVIDEHAEMTMRVETRPERLRPAAGWPEPADVYKARLFLRRTRKFEDPEYPDLAGTISFKDLPDDIERDAINSVLIIGPFAYPKDAETWYVTHRLIRYVTKIAADFDRLRRFNTNTDGAQQSDSARAGEAARAAPRRNTDEHPRRDEYLNRGFRAFRDRADRNSQAKADRAARSNPGDEDEAKPAQGQGDRFSTLKGFVNRG